jgi:polygalacturonase
MRQLSFYSWLIIWAIAWPAAAQVYQITDFGAVGDGRTLNTQAIQQAIDSCARRGGGTVWVPAGVYLCGELTLASHLTLHLDNGAVLLGSPELAHYPNRHFLHGRGLRHVTLTGQGTIDGNGPAFFNPDWTPKPRPEPWIAFRDCQHLTVSGIRLVNSPAHTLSFRECDRVSLTSLEILNDPRSPNTDGIDLRNTRNVRIADCHIETGDDAICLKASLEDKPPKYLVENILVSNCFLQSDDAAIKLGTGSGYLTRNCVFSNCIIQNTRFGVALFMQQGGQIENYQFNNLIIQGRSRHPTEYPIFIDIDKLKADSPFGRIDGVEFNQLTIETRGQVLIAGQPSAPVQNLSFANVRLRVVDATNPTGFKKPRGNKNTPHWPECADLAGENGHLVIGHARHLRFQNFVIETNATGAKRKAIILKNVENTRPEGIEVRE